MGKKDTKKTRIARDYFFRMAPLVLMRIHDTFDNMEQFKHFTLSSIKQEEKSIGERFKRETKGMTDEEIDQYSDWASEDYFMVKDVFSRISINSFIVILYSYIESGLNSLCNAMYSDRARLDKKYGKEALRIRYTDMQGEGVKRAKLYLEKVFSVDLHAGEQPWAEIDALRRIRNVIVHDEEWVNEELAKNQCITARVKKGFLEIEQGRDGSLGRITVKPEYLGWIIEWARKFFGNIGLNDNLK